MSKREAICTGSFDPVTLGHVDIITRASGIFDKVYVAVMRNPLKKTIFSLEERAEFLRKSLSGIVDNVDVIKFDGMLSDLIEKLGTGFIVKGVRTSTDFDYEFEMAFINKELNPKIETIFLPANTKNIFLRSSTVKQIMKFDGDISKFVPGSVIEDIKNKFKERCQS